MGSDDNWCVWCGLVVAFFTSRCGEDVCTAKEVMSVADAMASNGMKELGYDYINLDGVCV